MKLVIWLSIIITTLSCTLFAFPTESINTTENQQLQKIKYYGEIWIIKQASIENECSTGITSQGKKAEDNCLQVLLDIEKTNISTTPSEQSSSHLPLAEVLKVQDNIGNQYFPFTITMLWDKDGKWLGYMYYFSISKESNKFYIVIPGNEKILLNIK